MEASVLTVAVRRCLYCGRRLAPSDLACLSCGKLRNSLTNGRSLLAAPFIWHRVLAIVMGILGILVASLTREKLEPLERAWPHYLLGYLELATLPAVSAFVVSYVLPYGKWRWGVWVFIPWFPLLAIGVLYVGLASEQFATLSTFFTPLVGGLIGAALGAAARRAMPIRRADSMNYPTAKD
jgi:hypothetical protein